MDQTEQSRGILNVVTKGSLACVVAAGTTGKGETVAIGALGVLKVATGAADEIQLGRIACIGAPKDAVGESLVKLQQIYIDTTIKPTAVVVSE